MKIESIVEFSIQLFDFSLLILGLKKGEGFLLARSDPGINYCSGFSGFTMQFLIRLSISETKLMSKNF